MRRLSSEEGFWRQFFVRAAGRPGGLMGMAFLLLGLASCAVANGLDWLNEVEVVPEQARPDPQIDMAWLPREGDGLTRSHNEAVMNAHEIRRLYVLKEGVARLAIAGSGRA